MLQGELDDVYARTTPAQKPRGRTLSKTFPVSVCIIILMSGFRRLYHTSLVLVGATVFASEGVLAEGAKVYNSLSLPKDNR